MVAGGDLCPAQQRADPQAQLIQIDGFHHVIVNSCAIPPLLGGKIVSCRHKQDGDIFIQAAYRPGKFKTVNFRHHNVRDDQVKHALVQRVVGIAGTQAAGCYIAALIEEGTDRAIQVGIVLYY